MSFKSPALEKTLAYTQKRVRKLVGRLEAFDDFAFDPWVAHGATHAF
jgi:hypothetical protein